MHAESQSSYPVGLETTPLLGEDRELYHQRLLEDSSRLFKENIDIDIFLLSQKTCEHRPRSSLYVVIESNVLGVHNTTIQHVTALKDLLVVTTHFVHQLGVAKITHPGYTEMFK